MHVPDRPLSGVEDVDWPAFPDCLRDTARVPVMLRRLEQGDPVRAELRDRLAMVSSAGEHLSAASVAALPFLRRLAFCPLTVDRVGIVALLIDIALVVEAGPAPMYGKDQSMVAIWCRNRLRVDRSRWFDLIDHADHGLRRHSLAAILAGLFPRRLG